MGRRDEAIPEDFLEHLKRHVRGLAAEPKRVQMNVARMLWAGMYRVRQHAKYEGFVFYTYQELDEWFGRRKFQGVNERLGLFEVTEWSQKQKLTKGYRMTAETAVIIERYFTRRSEKLTAMLFGDGVELKTIPAAIASKDATGRTTTAWPEASGLRLVPVNIDQMKLLRAHLVRELREGKQRPGLFTGAPHEERIERLLDEVRHLIGLAQTKPAGHGFIAHRYVQSASGRLYAKGWSLQNAAGIVKDAALAGMWEYDFANCHYSILIQMAAQFDCQCDAIEHYLRHKGEVRQAIAREAEITEGNAKQCLLAIMYGARKTLWLDNSIPSLIGLEAAERLFGVDLFVSIAEDIKRARKAIVTGWERDRRGWVTNAFGRSIGGRSATPEQLLAHLIQGVEASALRAILRQYPAEVVLAQHDGFASRIRLDAQAIERAVTDATHYRLAVEEKRIAPNVDRYFQERRIQKDYGRKRRRTKASSPPLAG